MENDFSNAKVGDTVWDSQKGFGTIKNVNISTDNTETVYPIGVKIGDDYIIYTIEGYSRKSDINPALFWDAIKIVPPQKPKRKTEKTIERWLNFYPNNDCFGSKTHFYSYETKEKAEEKCHKETRLGEACHVIHKYIIEE